MKIKITKKDFLPHIACDVELDIGAGRILLIKGENGTGKSTLASEVFDLYQDKVSLVRQSALDLFYDRSVGKIKKIFLDATKDQLDEKLFEKYWCLFHLDQKSDRLQSALSGGEEQMLKICMGAFIKKDVLIFDEPSQNLDSTMRVVLNDLIHELQSLHKAIVIIEHDSSWISIVDSTLKLSIEDKTLKGRI